MTRHGLDKTILAAALAVSLGGCTGLGNTEGDWLCPTAQGEGCRTIAQADRADGGSAAPGAAMDVPAARPVADTPAAMDVPAARPVSDIPAADTPAVADDAVLSASADDWRAPLNGARLRRPERLVVVDRPVVDADGNYLRCRAHVVLVPASWTGVSGDDREGAGARGAGPGLRRARTGRSRP